MTHPLLRPVLICHNCGGTFKLGEHYRAPQPGVMFHDSCYLQLQLARQDKLSQQQESASWKT